MISCLSGTAASQDCNSPLWSLQMKTTAPFSFQPKLVAGCLERSLESPERGLWLSVCSRAAGHGAMLQLARDRERFLTRNRTAHCCSGLCFWKDDNYHRTGFFLPLCLADVFLPYLGSDSGYVPVQKMIIAFILPVTSVFICWQRGLTY